MKNAAMFAGVLGMMLLGASFAGDAEEKVPPRLKTVQEAYPGLTSGALTYARLDRLPEGVLFAARSMEITLDDINKVIKAQPEPLCKELEKNALFVLEQDVTNRLLPHLARETMTASGKETGNMNDTQLVQAFFDMEVFKNLRVSDAEAAEFFEQNKDMLGGATYRQVEASLKSYLLNQKKQKVASEYIRTLGKRMNLRVSAAWAKKQAALALDNPVDRARRSGKPSLVDFGASGCRPCDMMAPILETLREKYAGQLNVVFVHVGQQQILASRYGVQSIPVQVFFDRKGQEVFRHIGFFAQEEIEAKLKEIGVQ